MNRPRQNRLSHRERGGYITPYAITQHLMPPEPSSNVIYDGTTSSSNSSVNSFSEREQSPNRRKGFWARLRRPRSHDGRLTEEVFAIPNKAGASVSSTLGTALVWHPVQQMWVFDNSENSTCEPYRPERRASSTLPTSPSKGQQYTDEDLQFAQLPGHYALGRIYNCLNSDQVLPTYHPTMHANDVGRKTNADGQWMLVAQRIEQSTSKR